MLAQKAANEKAPNTGYAMPDDVKKKKAALRLRMRSFLAMLSPGEFAEKSLAAQRVLLASPLWRNASTIAIYAAMPEEAATDMLFATAMKEGRRLLLPRIIDREHSLMEFAVCEGSRDLAPGPYGILQPTHGASWHRAPDLLLLPGLAFDRDGYRLGYGGGYYDRFLAGNPGWGHAACGFCLGGQILAHIPHDDHDCRVMALASEEELLCL